MSPNSAEKNILLVGGGHAHIQVLDVWTRAKPAGLRVTVISDEPQAPYSGMVPGFLLGLYTRDEITLDLAAICGRAGAELVTGRAVRVDAPAGRVRLADGSWRDFDLASFNVGGRTDEPDDDRVIQVKPLPRLIAEWERMLEKLKAWRGRQVPRIAIVGGGSSGVELALTLAAVTAHLRPQPTLTLWQRLQPMNSHGAMVRQMVARELRRAGVRVRTGIDVVSWANGVIEFHSVAAGRGAGGSRGQATGGREDVDFVLLATPVKPDPIFRDSGLPVDDLGFLKVTETLQVPGHGNLFGAGDCIHFPRPLPRSGVYAVRQGRHLARSLAAAAQGAMALAPYDPQTRSLALLTLGGPRALASYGSWGLTGRWLWRWKDRIDRRFMASVGK